MNEVLYRIVMDELPVLISDSDLHISQLVLTLLGTVMDISPNSIRQVLCAHVHECMCTCMCIHVCACMCTCEYLGVCIRTCTCMCIFCCSHSSPSPLTLHQIRDYILPNTLTLVLSSLLQGSALNACLQFFSKLVKLQLPGLGFRDIFKVPLFHPPSLPR